MSQAYHSWITAHIDTMDCPWPRIAEAVRHWLLTLNDAILSPMHSQQRHHAHNTPERIG
ncbi:MAG TPA: hypothetical protein VKQ34_00145 [Candidatus Saccharimonadales bacterium]|nr:hypothetical protein [Candidatus Saccharimonadales bacterium]